MADKTLSAQKRVRRMLPMAYPIPKLPSIQGTLPLPHYFQKIFCALKKFFQGLKKIFQGMKKLFQALEKIFSSMDVTFPDFTRHFLLALSETVDSLLRAILIQ